MKKKTQLIQDKIEQIMQDINTEVLKKHGLGDIHVVKISFSTTKGCGPGFEEVCEYYGNDPVTGKPIIICTCVPIKGI